MRIDGVSSHIVLWVCSWEVMSREMKMHISSLLSETATAEYVSLKEGGDKLQHVSLEKMQHLF